MMSTPARVVIITVGTVLTVSLTIALFVRQPTLPSSTTQQRARASAARLENYVDALVTNFPARNAAHPEEQQRAAHYIAEQFRASGARTSLQSFVARGHICQNVLASLGPEDSSLPLLVIGAHYDAFAARAPLPGADDNASGTAGVIELARILSQADVKVPVLLVAFANEEPPFFGSDEMGSAVHAASLATAHRQVRGMICLEMIGYYANVQSWPAPLFALLYPKHGRFVAVSGGWPDRELTRDVRRGIQSTHAIDAYSFTGPREVSDASDQRNYWSHGWPAVMVGDTAYLRNPHYHTAHDVPDTLDYTAMAHVVDGVANAVMQIPPDR